MSPSLVRACAAFAAGILGLSVASACIELQPRQVVEFAPGSAQIPGDQMVVLMKMLEHARERPGTHQVSVRGFADRGSNHDPKSWAAEDLALADARARALSEAVRTLGNENCVYRMAFGNLPEDAPAARTDAARGPRVSRGVVVMDAADTKYEPAQGVRVETDCGPPAPPRAVRPKA